MADERYQKLLGITPADEIPTYYELLAIDRETADADSVEKAYKIQIRKLQEIRTSKDKGFLEFLKEELRKARRILADSEKRKDYDASLLVDAVNSFKEFVQPLMLLGRISKSVFETMLAKGVSDGLSDDVAKQVIEEIAKESGAVLELDERAPEPEPAPEPRPAAGVAPQPEAEFAPAGADYGDYGAAEEHGAEEYGAGVEDAQFSDHGSGYDVPEDEGPGSGPGDVDEPAFVDDVSGGTRSLGARRSDFYADLHAERSGAEVPDAAPVVSGPWARDRMGRAAPPWGRGNTRTPWSVRGVVRNGSRRAGTGSGAGSLGSSSNLQRSSKRWLSPAEQRQLAEAVRVFNLGAQLAKIANDVHTKLRFYFPPANGKSSRTYQINGVSYEKVFDTEQKMYRDTLKKLEAARVKLGDLQGEDADDLRARLSQNSVLVKGYLEEVRQHKMRQLSGLSQSEELRVWQEFVSGRRSNKLYQMLEELPTT